MVVRQSSSSASAIPAPNGLSRTATAKTVFFIFTIPFGGGDALFLTPDPEGRLKSVLISLQVAVSFAGH
jgi:hypothetical protein